MAKAEDVKPLAPTFTGAADPKVLGAYLAECRIAVGLTQQQVADRMHCDRAMVVRLEKGQRSPTFVTLNRYAQALGASLQISLEADAPN